MVDAWAADITRRHETALLAWRRQDVADLNRLARHRWDLLGNLTGSDIRMPGGRAYAAGDRVVALTPNPEAGTVTSEQLIVTAVAPARIAARTNDGRPVVLTGDAVDAEHLDHAYALTVHRTQGATCDRAHVLAAGGGRELAYVAMSRARDRTTIHTTADDLAQAVDDLAADWAVERHQRWITDSPATVGHENGPLLSLEDAEVRLWSRRHQLRQLHAGAAQWQDSPAGHAARRLADARAELQAAQHRAETASRRPWTRRSAERHLNRCRSEMEAASRTWKQVGEPHEHRLEAAIEAAEADVRRARTEAARMAREAWRDVPERETRWAREMTRTAELEPPGMELGL
jgi:hypothetical protein